MQHRVEQKYGNFGVVASCGLLLTYALPEAFWNATVGALFVVPLRSGKQLKSCVGVFLGWCEKPTFVCSEVSAQLPFAFSQQECSLLEWVAHYYLMPLEKTWSLLAPSFVWDTRKHPDLHKRLALLAEEKNKPIRGEISVEPRSVIALNEAQERAVQSILASSLSTTLLYGVTGAGKTEVYLTVAKQILNQGKSVLILVPEIVLTPQMSMRFRAVFGNNMAILHSGLTPVEYMREWLKICCGEVSMVLGVRTAVFCPLKNIGLIVVDEEHDQSYKNAEAPGYHARDVAVMRAKLAGAKCLLGSATPSLESMYNVKNGKYHYVELMHKYSHSRVEGMIIDAKKEMPRMHKKNKVVLKSSQVDSRFELIAPHILDLVRENKRNEQQCMVLINRRGFINFALCAHCGTSLMCPNCSVTTTLHHNGQLEICHYCAFQVKTRQSCGACGAQDFLLRGFGSQNVEHILQTQIPELRIERLDRDVMTSNTRLSHIIDRFRTREVDCLVGTQLLAKGHDFPNVTLVVILHLEDALFLPDFRSAERTFQLLTQAMGRAGRGAQAGKVVLQSFVPEHPILSFALNADWSGFLTRELKLRELSGHPPFSRQILLEVRHRNKEMSFSISKNLRDKLVAHWEKSGLTARDVRLAGPYPASIERLEDAYRAHICIHFSKALHPGKVVEKKLFSDPEFAKWTRVQVDPYSFL